MTPLVAFIANFWSWIQTHPVSGTIVCLYLLGLGLVAASSRDRDNGALGGYIILGVVGLIVWAVLKWAFGVVFEGV
jgi:hypothetical protein